MHECTARARGIDSLRAKGRSAPQVLVVRVFELSSLVLSSGPPRARLLSFVARARGACAAIMSACDVSLAE